APSVAGPFENTDALRRSLLLRGLPVDALERLLATAQRKSYRRGEVLFRQGEPAFGLDLIVAGRLKRVLLRETGEEAILSVLGPGDLAGEISLLDGEPRSATIVALEPVETVILSRADFLDLLQRSPEMLK